jgi:pSer/pThr/pTyr-binding forkhead associated (FHA) protein
MRAVDPEAMFHITRRLCDEVPFGHSSFPACPRMHKGKQVAHRLQEVETMKVMLVVAQGVHTGKIIPVGTAQFLIGRDPHCNLRPASPSISKQHCGIFVRDSKVFLQDYGSTNGTLVNGEQVIGEQEVTDGDKLKVGPLEFVIAIEITVPAAVAKTVPASATATVAMSDTIPAQSGSDNEGDAAAAMLLSMDDKAGNEPTTEAAIPDGSTVMDIPSVDAAKPDAAKKEQKAKGDTSKAAADLLSKYMRRPRT